MGMWLTTKFAFGIDLGKGIPKQLYLTDDFDKEYNDRDGDVLNFFEHWKKAKCPDFPFDILTYCSYDYSYARYFLAYEPTIQTGYSEEPLFVQFPQIDVNLVKQLIEENGFGENVNPMWSIVSLYG